MEGTEIVDAALPVWIPGIGAFHLLIVDEHF